MSRGGDVRQQITLEMNTIGADTVTILAQATRELQASFREAVAEFEIDNEAAKLVTNLGKIASGLTNVANLANHEAESMAQAAAATDAFIAKTNASLEKQDAAQAKLDDAARKRLDAKAAKDKATLESIGEAADRGAKAAQKAADDIAKAADREAAATAKASVKRQQEIMQAILDEDRRAKAIQATADQIIAANAKEVTAQRAKDDADIKAFNSTTQTTAATREQIQALKDMGIIQDKVDASVKSTTKNTGGFASKADDAANKAKRMGYNMMSIAYADDDVRYGLGAVINNIPMLAQAFGASQTWAAAITIGSVAIYELGKAMQPVASQFLRDWGMMTDQSKLFVSSVDDAKAKLEALKAKTYKVQIDYDEIEQAERTLEIMQERLNAFNQGRKDNLTDEAAKQAKEATHAYGGGTEGMLKAVYETEKVGGFSHAEQGNLDAIKQSEKALKDMKSAQAAGNSDEFTEERISVLEKRIEHFKHEVEVQERAWAKDEVGAFQTGDFQAIQRMQARARRTPGAFARVGPGGLTSGEAIANLPSTPQETLRRIDEDEAIKAREEHERETTRQYKERLSDDAKARAKAKANATEAARKEEEVRRAEEAAGKLANDIDKGELRGQAKGVRGRARDEAAHIRDMKDTAKAMAHVQDVGAENYYAGQFQRQTGGIFNDLQTQGVGKEIYGQVKQGVNAQVAMRESLRKLLAELQRRGEIDQQQQAEILQAAGLAEQAANIVRQHNTKLRQMARDQRRGRTQGPTNQMTFGG